MLPRLWRSNAIACAGCDAISIGIARGSFTAAGHGHVEWECDDIHFKTVVVRSRDARVYLETTEG